MEFSIFFVKFFSCYCLFWANKKNKKTYIDRLRACQLVHCTEHSNCRRTYGLCACLDYLDIAALEDTPFVRIPSHLLETSSSATHLSEKCMESELSSNWFKNMRNYI